MGTFVKLENKSPQCPIVKSVNFRDDPLGIWGGLYIIFLNPKAIDIVINLSARNFIQNI